ncbi:DUF5955 family protein [Actinoplanes sp. NPDC051513]|uniref:DUF5955 family protein n=1 Tax=Actinoplanes sp. NPDC051513 TaxID=3363908 RepID=UPI0037AFFB5E
MSNEINIGGSAYGPIANGPRARAVQRDVTISRIGGEDGDALLAALATLRLVTDQHAALLPEVERVRKDLDSIATEAGAESPDTPAIRDTILRIIRRVGMVEPVRHQRRARARPSRPARPSRAPRLDGGASRLELARTRAMSSGAAGGRSQ